MDMMIRRLTPELAEDYMDFFDNTAFTDHADWRGCYCIHFHWNAQLDAEHERCVKQEKEDPVLFNRRSVKSLVLGGGIRGYLYYVDGKVAGWCNANDRENYDALQENIKPELWQEPSGEKVLSIVCFSIAPDMRGTGVATTLLLRICADAVAEGYDYIEAYPHTGSNDMFVNHHGPEPLYQKLGFVLHRESDGQGIYRKYLK